MTNAKRTQAKDEGQTSWNGNETAMNDSNGTRQQKAPNEIDQATVRY
jgi:hypothetical protein